MSQVSALGLDRQLKKSYYKRKSPVIISGAQTQVLGNSMTVAESAPKPLHHLDHYNYD